ncbi:hypothetical protein P4S72_03310 [Vibrio sp. PP-XX7]
MGEGMMCCNIRAKQIRRSRWKGQVATTLNHVGTQQLQTLAGIADKGKPLLLTSGFRGCMAIG